MKRVLLSLSRTGQQVSERTGFVMTSHDLVVSER